MIEFQYYYSDRFRKSVVLLYHFILIYVIIRTISLSNSLDEFFMIISSKPIIMAFATFYPIIIPLRMIISYSPTSEDLTEVQLVVSNEKRFLAISNSIFIISIFPSIILIRYYNESISKLLQIIPVVFFNLLFNIYFFKNKHKIIDYFTFNEEM